MSAYPWFKVDAMGWIQGSIRVDLNIAQQGVFMGLLAMASQSRVRDGTIQFAPGKPMPRERIAAVLAIPLDLLNETIEICCQDKNKDDDRHRIEVWEDGTIEIVNWDRFQAMPPGKDAPQYIPADVLYKEQQERIDAVLRKEQLEGK